MMNTTISVVVMASYVIYDDFGNCLIPDGQTYVVEQTNKIQEYIDLGQLIVVPDAPTPTPASEPASVVEVVEEESTPAKKARASVQKQENSNG